MFVVVKNESCQRICAECSFLGEKGKYPCWCYAGNFPIKPSETDLKDGMCPIVMVTSEGCYLCTKRRCPIQYDKISKDCNLKSCEFRTEW